MLFDWLVNKRRVLPTLLPLLKCCKLDRSPWCSMILVFYHFKSFRELVLVYNMKSGGIFSQKVGIVWLSFCHLIKLLQR
ncbi:hypothetical protein L6452_02521 [Arctium lappa]|uniref:Uncharacterized protein n=1 Tax=Arctium lappa TaxID=4217 RepID=A0ACB9FK94_ARCLA|nr:hypothetical protein L6452_02521 [Arctium lappa]